MRIDVEKSASHQLSQNEIGSDNPVRNIYLSAIFRPPSYGPPDIGY